MSLYFVRHGESTTNASGIVTGQKLNPGLTPNGKTQAENVARWIRNNDIVLDVIIASPSRRTLETAGIIASNINYPASRIVQWHDLIERGFGDLEGNRDEVYFQTPEAIATSEHGAEPLAAFYGRAQNVLNQLDVNYPGKRVLLVSHNGMGKMLRLAIAGKNHDAYDRIERLPNAELIQLIP